MGAASSMIPFRRILSATILSIDARAGRKIEPANRGEATLGACSGAVNTEFSR
jgi:hypothetical protein